MCFLQPEIESLLSPVDEQFAYAGLLIINIMVSTRRRVARGSPATLLPQSFRADPANFSTKDYNSRLAGDEVLREEIYFC